jgi:RNA polymerase sigma factor (sigma-70 family)
VSRDDASSKRFARSLIALPPERVGWQRWGWCRVRVAFEVTPIDSPDPNITPVYDSMHVNHAAGFRCARSPRQAAPAPCGKPHPTPHGLQDRHLVERYLRARSDEAFRALYDRHSPRLRASVQRMVGNDPPLADEIVQDTWIQALRGLPTFRWESSLARWLYVIAANRLRMRWRRRPRGPDREDPDSIPARPTGPPIESLDVTRAIARLPNGYRTVLVLHGLHGFSHREISRMLGISEGTSRSQLSRARGALRHMLAEEPGAGRCRALA